LETYGEKDKRKYVHFVDGGITDNLGLRAISDIMSITGGSEHFIEAGIKPPRHVLVIMVDATTERTTDMDISNKEPSAVGVIGAVANLQLTRYDYDSRAMVKEKMDKWAAEISTPQRPVKTHFISISIQDVKDPKTLAYLNSIPTSFALNDEQVDRLIATGREQLRNNPEFQQLLTDLESQ